MKKLFPLRKPYRTGTLKVSNLHTLYYQEAGNPKGKPIVFLHGGPGVGIIPHYIRLFDPKFYRIILPDQRGAARSTPHAELKENTTWNLVEDLEKLREQLGIKKWLVSGGSWGSTLSLAYAIKHPKSIVGIIIRGVFLCRQSETDWLFKDGCHNLYPDEWELFQKPIPQSQRKDMVKAYYKALTGKDEKLKIKAAKAWTRWEASTMNLIPDLKEITEFLKDKTALAIARIECHYTYNKFFMPNDNYMLTNIRKKAKNIPTKIVQGRYDVICPMKAAWDLHKTMSKSTLNIVQTGAHSPFEAPMIDKLIQASEDFKKLSWK